MRRINSTLRRFCTLWLAALCLLCLFPSCTSSGQKNTGEIPAVQSDAPVFVGTQIETGSLSPCPTVEPCCRADSLTFAAYGEGGLGWASLSLNDAAISSFDPFGVEPGEECVPLCGCLTENGYAILVKDGAGEDGGLREVQTQNLAFGDGLDA